MKRYSAQWICLLVAVTLFSVTIFAAIPAAAQVKIRFQSWMWNEQPWVKGLEEFQKAFNAANPDIQVVREDSRYGDKESVFITQSQAKAAADIAHFTYRAIQPLADRGYLMDLTPFVEKEGGAKYLAQWDPLPLQLCKYKGKLYCLPDDVDPGALMYNTIHFKEAGLDPNEPPATWGQFLDYAKKLTRSTKGDGKIDRWGVSIVGAREEGVFMRFSPFLFGAGGNYLTPDGTRSALDTPEALEGFKFYVELYTKHKVVPPGVVEQGAQQSRTQVAYGMASMMIAFPGNVDGLQSINPKINMREVMAVAPMPVGKIPATSSFTGFRLMSAFTQYPDAAWKVYRGWHDYDTQMRNYALIGDLSARLDVRKSPQVQNDKFSRVYASQAPYVRFEPLAPEWLKIADIMITAIQEALIGSKTPEQALKDAHIATNRVLGK